MPSPLGTVSCSSTTFCVAVQSDGHVLTRRIPTGGVGAWIHSGGSGVPAPKLACPDPSFCVAGAGPERSTRRRARPPRRPGARAMVDGAHQIDSLACPTSTLCLAGDDGGNIITSTNPVGGPRPGRSPTSTEARSSKLSPARWCRCVSLPMGPSACSSRPTPQAPYGRRSRSPAMTRSPRSPARRIASCVAVDGFGSHVVTSSHPAGSWRLKRVTRGIGEDPQIWRVACASRSLCLALVTDMGPPGASGATGTLYAFNPVGGAHSFRRLSIRGAEPSIGFRRAFVSSGSGLRRARLQRPRVQLHEPGARSLLEAQPLCTPLVRGLVSDPALCVALHSDPDQVVSSGEPPTYATATPTGSIDVFAGRAHTTVEIDPAGGLTGIACASKSRCVAVDDGGNVLSTSSPTGGPGAWTRSHVDDWPLAAVRCPSTSLCVAVDRGGRAVVGRR